MKSLRSKDPDRPAVEAWARTVMALAVAAAKVENDEVYMVRQAAILDSLDELALRYGNRGLLRAMMTWARMSVEHASGGQHLPEGTEPRVRVRRSDNAPAVIPEADQLAAGWAAGFLSAYTLGGERLASRHAELCLPEDPSAVGDCIMHVLLMVAKTTAELPYGYATLAYEVSEEMNT